MKTVVQAILVLAGLFTGGSSLFYLPFLLLMVVDYQWYGMAGPYLLIPLAGLAFSVFCFRVVSRVR